MLYLFHGPDVVSSRRALTDIKTRYETEAVAAFDGFFEIDEFVRACETRSMLAERKLVIVEVGKQQTAARLRQLGNYLGQVPNETDLAFWTSSTIRANSPLLKQTKEAGGRVLFFKERPDKKVFPFLDNLGQKNKRGAYLRLHQLLNEGNDPLYLLTMIVWQMRNLINVKYQSSNVKTMNPYIRGKTKRLGENFAEGELTEIYHQLLQTEVKIKTGQTDPRLALDLLVERICQNTND